VSAAVTRLATKALEKLWGTAETDPWFRNPERKKIGEVWFESPPDTPLLIKFLFTSESLSIQVHPEDEYARKHHESRGKTEMWHILRAENGAKIAAGPRAEITRAALENAAGKPEIVDLLNWIPVKAGDTYFIPAGTIHALGGGLALCEIQQLSDVTYRLYDYGRRPDLHIEHSLNVAHLKPCEGKREPVELEEGRHLLAECDYFRTEKLTISGNATCRPGRIYVILEGQGLIGDEPFQPGEAFAVQHGDCRIDSSDASVLAVSV